MLVQEYNNLAELLNHELKLKQLKNKSFSLRAFANLLKIAPSQLSLILKNKKGISSKKAYEVAKALEYGDLKTEWFIALVQKDFSRSKADRITAHNKLINSCNKLNFKNEEIDQLNFEYSWVHSAIRAMTNLENFKFNDKWIAKKLSIDPVLAKKAMNELLDNNFIIKDKNGKYTLNNYARFYWSGKNAKRKLISTTSELENLFLDLHEKNSKSLIYDSFHFFALDSSKLETYKSLISKFKEELEKLIIENPKRDQLICMKVGAYILDE